MIVGSITKLNLIPSGVMPVIYISQYDKGYEKQFSVYNGDSPYNVPAGVSATIRGTKADGYGVAEAMTVTVGSNIVSVTITEQMVAAEGTNLYELVFVDTDGLRIATINMVWAVKKDALGGAVISESDLDYAEQVIDELQTVAAFKAQVDANASGIAAETEARIAADSALSTRLTAEASARTSTDSTLQSQIDQLVAPSGSAPSAAEVQNARIGADGVTYNTLGDAIRTQVADLRGFLNGLSPTKYASDFTWYLKKTISSTGEYIDNAQAAVTGMIPVSGGAVVINSSITPGTDSYSTTLWLNQYIDEVWQSRKVIASNAYRVLDAGTNGIRIAFGYSTSSGIMITMNDIEPYFSVNVFEEAAAQVNVGEIENRNFLTTKYNDGDINAITLNGLYWWESRHTPTAAPITGSGMVVHFRSNDNISYQLCYGYTAVQVWFRIKKGSATKWTEWRRLLYADEVPAKLKLFYSPGPYISGTATEQVKVYAPTATGYIVFRLLHFVDTSNNCDGWQIYSAARVDDSLSSSAEVGITATGEWECALRLAGRDDFSGGHTHGDEMMTSVVFLLDGVPTDITTVTTKTDVRDLRLIQTSTLYDPADHTTPIAEHGKEYIFAESGLTLNQSVKWLVSEQLANCYMAMFTPRKAMLDRIAANSNFDVIELPTDDAEPLDSINIPNANAATMWDTSSGVFAAVAVPVYPTGLSGGDRITVSDNSGNAYNKLYFKVCESGTSSVGELWKSTTTYKIGYKGEASEEDDT